MDLIQQLASQVGVETDQAQALAGGALGLVRSSLSEEGSEESVKEFDSAIPELSQWEKAAQAATGSSSALGGAAGGLLGAVAGGLGGAQVQRTAALAGLLSKLGLDTSKSAMVAPILYSFLKERMSEQQLGLIEKAAPFLTSGDSGSAAGVGGAVTGALGGLFGS